MFRKIIRTLLGVIVVASAMPLLAESTIDHQMRVNVPFAFSANDRTMPAGKYTISLHPENGTILMQTEGQPSLFVSTLPTESTVSPDRGSLVFQRYGSTLFLSEIWTRGSTSGLEVPFKADAQKTSHTKHSRHSLVIQIP